MILLTGILEVLPVGGNQKRKVIIFWCIFLTVFAGIRWENGTDWFQYYEHFKQSDWSNIFNYDRYGNGRETLEPGFVFLNALIRHLFGEFYIYNIIITGFIQYTNYRFSKHFSPKHPLFLFIFISWSQAVCFPVRSHLSQAICYWAYIYLQKKQPIKCIITMLLAYSIHHQCIALLPLFFVGYVHIKDSVFIILYVILGFSTILLQEYFAAFMLMFDNDVAEKAYKYTQYETDTGGKAFGVMGLGLNFFFTLIYLFVRDKLSLRGNHWYNTLLNSYLIYMIILFAFSKGMGDLTRLTFLFLPAQAILFTSAISYFVDVKGGILKKIAIIFFFLYGAYKVSNIGSWVFFEEANIPYKTIFGYYLK